MPKTSSYLMLCVYVGVGLILSDVLQRLLGSIAGLAVLVAWALLGRLFWEPRRRR